MYSHVIVTSLFSVMAAHLEGDDLPTEFDVIVEGTGNCEVQMDVGSKKPSFFLPVIRVYVRDFG